MQHWDDRDEVVDWLYGGVNVLLPGPWTVALVSLGIYLFVFDLFPR